MNKKITQIISLLVFPIPLAYLITMCVLLSQNTLYNNENWIVQKRMLKMFVMGSDEFLLTRHPLHRNKLNLGSYFGFQKVQLAHQVESNEVDFEFKNNYQSYLDFIYFQNESTSFGIRLSNQKNQPSFNFELNKVGKFVKKIPIEININNEKWNTFSLSVLKNKLLAKLNGSQISKTEFLAKINIVSFQSGINGSWIDNISVHSENKGLFNESFSNHKHMVGYLILNYLALLFLGGILKFYLSYLNESFFNICIASLVAFYFMFGSWFFFDFYYYSGVVPRENGITKELNPQISLTSLNLEEFREFLFSKWSQLGNGKKISSEGIRNLGYPENRIWKELIYCGPVKQICKSDEGHLAIQLNSKKANIYRVLFIGTSQTIGSGAKELEETFVVKTHNLIASHLSSNVQLETLNISVSGSDAERLYKLYSHEYVKYLPDLVVINLSNNDLSNNFKIQIQKFIKINLMNKIKTVFLKEANYYEAGSRLMLLKNHQILNELASQNDIPILDLHEYLKNTKLLNSGIVWWDIVHLSSYGQNLVANWLAPQIQSILVKLPPHQRALIVP
jgi:lysophospholipase L1-like esterase